MDASNLATLFSPNILHKSKVGEFQVESPERAEQRNDIISVLKEMIESYVEIFEVSLYVVVTIAHTNSEQKYCSFQLGHSILPQGRSSQI